MRAPTAPRDNGVERDVVVMTWGRMWVSMVIVAVMVSLAPTTGATPLYTFVSAPDLWNTDGGDVTSASGWDPGEPNSINDWWRQATEDVLMQFASHAPSYVLVPGDAVEGDWYTDLDGYETFGAPIGVAGQRDAIREAGSIYYRQYEDMFALHGMRLLPALGDHELGDNPWAREAKQPLVPTFRNAWAKRFTVREGRYLYESHPPVGTQHARTAYAFRDGPVLFVSVDVFDQRVDGSVRIRVAGEQLRWLRHVLRAANADTTVEFIVVQGHTPVLKPAREARSSDLRVAGGSASPFWRALKDGKVDLYLCGEFHAISSATNGGVVQVVHGSTLGYVGSVSYLAVTVSSGQLDLALSEATITRLSEARLWQVGRTRPMAEPVVGPFQQVGTMTITAGGQELDPTGLFAH